MKIFTVIKLNGRLFTFVCLCCHDLDCARAVSRKLYSPAHHLAAPVSKICENHGLVSQ